MTEERKTGDLDDSGRESIARTLEIGGWVSLALLTVGSAFTMTSNDDGAGSAIIRAGILALLATPVFRLLAAAIAFRRAQNRKLLAICLFSLAVILASAVLGILRIGR